jgi:hypothetical protein
MTPAPEKRNERTTRFNQKEGDGLQGGNIASTNQCRFKNMTRKR